MPKIKTQKNKGFAPKGGKKQKKGGKKQSSLPSLSQLERIERELAEAQAEWMAEEAQERKERIQGMSRDELMRSPHWVYEMANEEAVKGTLNEMLQFFSDNNASVNLNLEALRQKALSDGGIDVEIDEEMYETIEFEGDNE